MAFVLFRAVSVAVQDCSGLFRVDLRLFHVPVKYQNLLPLRLSAGMFLAGCNQLCITVASVPRVCDDGIVLLYLAAAVPLHDSRCHIASLLQSCSVIRTPFDRICNPHHAAAAGARPPAVRTTARPYTAGRPTPQRRMKNTFARPSSWTCNPAPCCLAVAIAPHRREKSARRQFSPLGKQAMSGYSLYCSSQHSFITGIAAIHTVQCHSAKGAMGKLAGHQNTCERDNSRNRAHTVVQGRFCNPAVAQVGLGMATCARRKS